jgi:NADH dehydrogenase FAD-containing subunit
MGVPVPFQVVVIGAGFGGIGMAIALKQAASTISSWRTGPVTSAGPGATTATRA